MSTSNTHDDLRMEPILDAFSRVGVSVSTGYRMIKAGVFPRPVKVGRMSYVPSYEVDAWINALIAQRDGGAAA